MKNVVFLGYAVHPDINQGLSGKSVAGNKMELSILRELKRNGIHTDNVTVYPVAAFPHDRLIFVRRQKMDIGDGMYTDRIGFCNIPGIKQITQICSVYKCAKKIVIKHPDAIIMPFNMYPQVGVPAVVLKKRFGCRLVPILADLPIDDNYQRRGISKLVRKVFNNVTMWCIRKADDVIVLNKHARDVYAPKKKYIVVDGGIDIPQIKDNDHPITPGDGQKHILYTGSLAEYSGIAEMVKAMRYIDNPHIVLDIYGSGTLKEWICGLNEKNVCYHGTVDNETVMTLQRNAWLLVNPRPVDDEIAKVTFPSKIFEYMLSGTPVLATRLNGFTSEYYDKLFLAEDNRPETLAKHIMEIDRMPEKELLDIAKKAKEFIAKRKTWEYQGRRIANFLVDGEKQ